MLPLPVLLIPLYVIYAKLHLINTLYGLVIANVAFSLPLSTWFLKGFFDFIPPELEEAAMIDGCTKVGAMLRITFPLSLPGIVATSIFSFLIAWDEFFVAFTLTNNPKVWVTPVGISTFLSEFSIDWDLIMASAVIFTLPSIIFFLFVQKYLIAGMTAGAVKE
jgi:multiple sugar transport system permease protein